MREIILNTNQPVSLSIAADPRTSSTDYFDDQIWELTLNSGEPQALALQTTFGLRATKMRIFPRFSIGNNSSTIPSKYSKPPVIRKIFPNYIRMAFSPFESIAVIAEYWVSTSQSVCGRFRISNDGSKNQELKFELVALLNPSENGSRTSPSSVEGIPILAGSTENLVPVLFITGGSRVVDSPYPALVHDLELAPGNSKQFVWCHSAKDSILESLNEAREITEVNWDAEVARIELVNSGLVEIYTGEEGWDQIFSFSQKIALGLLHRETAHMKQISYVTTRSPDDGYSHRGDGSDYDPQWSGQTPIDTYYLSNLLLPGAPSIMENLLRNHLEAKNENGEIDWKPGLGGQRSNRLATPLLTSIAWKIYQIEENSEFLREIYPQLIEYLNSWFSEVHDRDADGIPEWDHLLQAGFEDHPIFARWHPWSHCVDITTAESPSLCAFLFNECQYLLRIANLLEIDQDIQAIESKAELLHQVVDRAWDEPHSGYTYWDRDGHTSEKWMILGQLTGSGTIELNRSYPLPQRLIFKIQTKQEITRKTQIIIHGLNQSGKNRIEIIQPEQILWFPSLGTATSEQIYKTIESIEVNGLEASDSIIISNSGLLTQDITTFLPLWAGIPSKKEARLMVENNLTNANTFWLDYGIPGCPREDSNSEELPCHNVYLPWCLFVGEGLLSYGYRDISAELVSKIMDAISISVSTDGCFSHSYNADSGSGVGENDALWGLAPLGLFLETLGVKIISPKKIHLVGNNPFPWPVTLKYQGTTILRGLEKTQVIFPDGQTTLISDPEPCLVSLE